MSAADRHLHPELQIEFDILGRVFGEARHAAIIKRVMARCCFLAAGMIPVNTLNIGEKNGGDVSGIRIADPAETRAAAPETPMPDGEYICDWIKEMDDWKLFSRSFVEDGVQYKKMYPPLQQATALLLLHEDPNLLFTAFHTIVRHLRCIFPGHIPHSQIIPDDDSPHAIFSPLRRITGHHIHASHQAYAAYLQYIPWTGTPDFLARRISSLRTLQSLLNDLGWYHVYQLDFVDARTLGGAAHHITTHDPVREWIVQNPDMATAPFPEAVFHLELDSLVLCTWAWIWCSLEQQSVGDLDTWFKMELPPSVVNNVKYMQGYWRAVEYWGQVVDKVGAWLDKADEEGGGGEKGGSGGEGDGGGEGERDGGGEGERRKRVVERLEGLYGNGRRMAIFWQFEESFDWKLQWKEKTEEKEKAEEKVKVKAKAKAE